MICIQIFAKPFNHYLYEINIVTSIKTSKNILLTISILSHLTSAHYKPLHASGMRIAYQ